MTKEIYHRKEVLTITQCERILRHLKTYGSITSWEAMQEYGVMRLASRISELRDTGLDIESVYEKNINRYGEKIKYVRYKLGGM